MNKKRIIVILLCVLLIGILAAVSVYINNPPKKEAKEQTQEEFQEEFVGKLKVLGRLVNMDADTSSFEEIAHLSEDVAVDVDFLQIDLHVYYLLEEHIKKSMDIDIEETLTVDNVFGQRFYEAMLRNGLITELESRRNLENVVVVLHPALITAKKHADEAVSIIEKSLKEVI